MNKKNLKRIIALCCSIALLSFCFIGCGSADDKDKGNTATENPTVSPTEEATVAPSPTTETTGDANYTERTDSGTITGGKPGTYTSKSKGYASDVSVTVTIGDDGLIKKIDVDASGETEGLGQVAAPKICDAVVEKQSLDVDAVSGSTYTSTATLAAIKDALTQAGIDTTAITQ